MNRVTSPAGTRDCSLELEDRKQRTLARTMDSRRRRGQSSIANGTTTKLAKSAKSGLRLWQPQTGNWELVASGRVPRTPRILRCPFTLVDRGAGSVCSARIQVRLQDAEAGLGAICLWPETLGLMLPDGHPRLGNYLSNCLRSSLDHRLALRLVGNLGSYRAKNSLNSLTGHQDRNLSGRRPDCVPCRVPGCLFRSGPRSSGRRLHCSSVRDPGDTVLHCPAQRGPQYRHTHPIEQGAVPFSCLAWDTIWLS